ncbi:aminoglycoside N(3)-acetyltransferase [Devosia nitrariae]|uniref:Aminoglycoside N(3)-acetyltransferase n=1 Tax=Devosia nitrariae TaxID=2071872 RepID=A0ABQ5W5J9_9HYPH|nr:AAC(3) family N-acetyltransferase [Devosia nitrariae]GLQ55206.1 AAC(3) family N-acetyltransferase [Devosia nitrariae]
MSEADLIARTDKPGTRESLAADLASLGLKTGETVIVHSSLSALGWIAGGPVAVIQALLDVLGPEGTLVMPAHSAGLTDPANWRAPPVPADWVDIIRANMPAFDPRKTPTNGMGQIAELFRTWPEVERSQHPNCSFAALGPEASRILCDHALDSPLDERSPLARLYDLDAKVLLLGVGFDRCTILHLSEHRAWPERPLEAGGAPVLVDGVRRWVPYSAPPVGDSDLFVPIGSQLAASGKAATGRVGAADCVLLSSRVLVDHAVSEWREGGLPETEYHAPS